MEINNKHKLIPKELLLEIGRKAGLINKEHIEKAYFQDLFLYYLYKKTNQLIFKGGTALYKLYNLPRFSEDLDFSLLKEMDIENLIADIAKNIHARVKEIKKFKNGFSIKIGFSGILTVYNTIRIDINIRNTVLGEVDVKSYIPPYIDINPFSLRVLSLKEIVAEKVHSLLSREKARDLYDLFFLLRFVDFDKFLVEKKLKLFGMKFESNKIKSKIRKLKNIYEPELKPFVLSELQDFEEVKNFVFKKMNIE